MTDLEITKLCAEAMGLHYKTHENNDDVNFNFPGVYLYDDGANMWHESYSPLYDDAQAMALLKRFRLEIFGAYAPRWSVTRLNDDVAQVAPTIQSADLNRAICECVAKMQKERGKT